ncbi:STAS domain-containing protein [Streptomyces ossamyceticus]|uniref:Anti-sigma factor antagonist n=1 Tax=Streptomyces ossamyceticus TaxID=249581 RepID=A0ABV2UNU3_9ACTN|nr:STAS domain-containing protein [Streptomyces ossamyceticus]
MTDTHGAGRPGRLSIGLTSVDGVRVVTLRGEIDHTVRERFTEALLPDGDAGARTVVDLSGVTFMDSSGVNVLVAAHHGMSDAQGWLRIAGARDPVRRLLHLVALDQVIACHPTVEEALAA